MTVTIVTIVYSVYRLEECTWLHRTMHPQMWHSSLQVETFASLGVQFSGNSDVAASLASLGEWMQQNEKMLRKQQLEAFLSTTQDALFDIHKCQLLAETTSELTLGEWEQMVPRIFQRLRHEANLNVRIMSHPSLS